MYVTHVDRIEEIKDLIVNNDPRLEDIFNSYVNNFTPNAKYINHEVDIKKFKKVLTDLSIVLSYDLEACKEIINIKYGHLKGISYPIFKECLFAFLNKKIDVLTSMFFAEQHSVPIEHLKRIAECDVPGDQPVALNAQEEEMKRIKETLSLTDDVNLIILHRSIYVLKKKFEEFNKEIKEIYKEYNENDNEEEGVVVDTEKVEEIVKRIGKKCLFEVDKKEFKDVVVDELCYAGGEMFKNGEVMERLKEFVGKERRKYNKIFKVKKERKEVDLKEFEDFKEENEEEDDMCKVIIEPIEEEVNEEEKEEEEEGNDEDLKEGERNEEEKEENNDEGEGEGNENVDEGNNEEGKEDAIDKSKSNDNNESNNADRKEGDDEKKSEKVEDVERNDDRKEREEEEEKKEDVNNEDEGEEKKDNDSEEEKEEKDDEHEEEKEKDEDEIKDKEKSIINKEDSIDMKQSNDIKSNIDDKPSNIPNNDNLSKSKSNLNNSHITNNNNNNENENLSNSNHEVFQPSTPPPELSETKSIHSSKPPLQKEYKKYYLYIETLPLILADFLTSTPLSIILERNPSNLSNLRVLFDNEIMSRLGEETTYQIHLLKSERLKECLFSLSKIENNISHYTTILTQKQLQNENTTYITTMLNKLTSTKDFLTKTINTIQNDTNTYNEYPDKHGNYLQDQTTTELNQTKPSNAMMLMNSNEQQQLPSINDISNIDNQHQSNLLNETVSVISNNNNNVPSQPVQPPSSAVVRFQTSVSSALSSARMNNSKNNSHSRILLRQPLTKDQKRVNALKEIFGFYARQHVNNNQHGTFDSLKLKLEHMNLSEFSKFCSEFQLLIPKDKRVEIFKKNISNTNTITINEFNVILPQLAKAIRDDKVNRLKKQILQNKLLLRHYKEQDDKKIIENISESIIVYKYANIDEQINKDKDEIKALLKKDENVLLEELYTYLEIDDEKAYRSKMKGFVVHNGKLVLPKIQSENRIKNITEKTKYEVKSMLTQHKLQMERDAEEKRKVEGMNKEYQKKQLEVFNRLYDKALKQRDKLERQRKKVNEVKFIQPTNRVDNPFRRYYKAESVIHGMWKHAEHNKGFDDAYYNVVPQFKEEVKKGKKEEKANERKVVRFVGEKVMENDKKEKEMVKDESVRDDYGKEDKYGNNRKKNAFTWESLEKMSINEFKEREDIARLLGINDL